MYSRPRQGDLADFFVKEFVVGLGWVSGLFLRIGIDPEVAIFEALRDVMEMLVPETGFTWIFWVTPTLLTSIAWIGAYITGGSLGVIAVIIALIGGYFYDSLMGWILVLSGILLGGFAVKHRNNYSIL